MFIMQAIVVLYLILVLLLGLYVNKYLVKTIDDYWIAGRRLGVIESTGTILATFISGATMVGYIAMYYRAGGFASMYSGLGLTIGFVGVMIFMAHKVRRTGFVTLGDLFQDRYGGSSRVVLSIITLYTQVGYVILQNLGLGTALSIVLGWPINVGITVASVVTVLYVMLGGMFAVVWTDVLQGVLIFFSTMIVLPYLVAKAGGFAVMAKTLKEIAPHFYHPTAKGMFDSSYAIRSVLMFGLGNIAFPAYFVRLYSARDELTARNSYIMAGCMLALFSIATRVIAGALRVIMPNMDPKLVEGIWPLAIKTLVNPLAGGILLAAIVAAIMSTVDSVLHVAGTVITRDFYQKLNKDATESHLIRVSQWAILIVGIFGWAVALMKPASIWDITFYIWAFVANGLAIPLICAFYWKRANLTGALASSIGGVGTTLVWNLLKNPMGIDYFYPGLAVAVVGMVIGSLMSPPPSEATIEKYFGPHMSFFNLPRTHEPFGGFKDASTQ